MFHRPVLTRRALVAGLSFGVLSSWVGAQSREQKIEESFKAIRARVGGRLGVHVLDTETGRRIGFDDDSRYAMASTFKLLLAAAVLSRVDRRELDFKQSVAISERDMISHSPVTSKYLPQGSITVRELCEAVVEVSDNPAANLLLKLVDGPPGLTKFIRTLGDDITRLDRTELELNTNLPGDPRDTTTPRAMVGSMERVLIGSALSAASRELLIGWLVNSRTGLQRIRSGLPPEWKTGDKTGTGENGAINDIAITWPPNRKPVLITIYMSESTRSRDELNAAHGEIARLFAHELATSRNRPNG